MRKTKNCNMAFLREIIILAYICFLLYITMNRCFDTKTNSLFIIFLFLLLVVDSFYSFDYEDYQNIYKINERKKRIDWLNSSRGKLGTFYVKCDDCNKIPVVKDDNIVPSDENGLMNGTTKGPWGKIALFNDDYVNVDQISCYNCLLDDHAKITVRNYQDLDSIPSNGPP